MTIQENWENWLSHPTSSLEIHHRSEEYKQLDLLKNWKQKAPENKAFTKIPRSYTLDFLYSDDTLLRYDMSDEEDFNESLIELTSCNIDSGNNVNMEIGPKSTDSHQISPNYNFKNCLNLQRSELNICFIFSDAFSNINEDQYMISAYAKHVLRNFDLVVSLDPRLNELIKKYGEAGELKSSVIFTWLEVRNQEIQNYYNIVERELFREILHNKSFKPTGHEWILDTEFDLDYPREYLNNALSSNIVHSLTDGLLNKFNEIKENLYRHRDRIRKQTPGLEGKNRIWNRICKPVVNYGDSTYSCSALKCVFNAGMIKAIEHPELIDNEPTDIFDFLNRSKLDNPQDRQQDYGISTMGTRLKDYLEIMKDLERAFSVYEKYSQFLNEESSYRQHCECGQCDNNEIWKWKHFHNYDTFDNATTFTFKQSCANVPLFDTNPLGNKLKENLLESWINNRQIEIRSRYRSEGANRRREQRGA